MPFRHVYKVFPAAGKTGEMRAVTEERVKELQAAGVSASLSNCAYGPGFPYLQMGIRFATLADHEKVSSDPATGARVAKYEPLVWALSQRPPVTILWESLQFTNPGASGKWARSNTMAPALGKNTELRGMLMEIGKLAEKRGSRSTLLVQVSGPETGLLGRTIQHDSLAEVEEARARNAGDGNWQS